MDQIQQWQNQCEVVSHVASSMCLITWLGENSSLTILVTQHCFFCCVYQLRLCYRSLLSCGFLSPMKLSKTVRSLHAGHCTTIKYSEGDIFSGAEVNIMLMHHLYFSETLF